VTALRLVRETADMPLGPAANERLAIEELIEAFARARLRPVPDYPKEALAKLPPLADQRAA
jgi:hypothetical protein